MTYGHEHSIVTAVLSKPSSIAKVIPLIDAENNEYGTTRALWHIPDMINDRLMHLIQMTAITSVSPSDPCCMIHMYTIYANIQHNHNSLDF